MTTESDQEPEGSTHKRCSALHTAPPSLVPLESRNADKVRLESVLEMPPSIANMDAFKVRAKNQDINRNKFHPMTVRSILLLVFLIQGIICFGCTWALLYSSGQFAINDAVQVERKETYRITYHFVEDYMGFAPNLLRLINSSATNGRVDLLNLDNVKYFLITLQNSLADAEFIYGNINRTIITVNQTTVLRVDDDQEKDFYSQSIYDNRTLGPITKHRLQNRVPLTSYQWFTNSNKTQLFNWSPVFPVMGVNYIAASTPIYKDYTKPLNQQNFLGAMAVLFNLDKIDSKLDDLAPYLGSGIIFIVDSRARIISGVSSIGPKYNSDGSRLSCIMSSDPVVRNLCELIFLQNITNGQVMDGDFSFLASRYSDVLNFTCWVIVALPNRNFGSMIFATSAWMAVFSIVVVAIGSLAIVLVTRAITSPLLYIKSELKHISNLIFDRDAHRVSPLWEVNRIQSSVKVMKNTLQTFQKYVPFAIVHKIIKDSTIAELGMKHRNVTVLYAGLFGFSMMADKEEPSRLLCIVHSYFEEVIGLIESHGGMVDKLVGDCVMAIFNTWFEPIQDHALQACRAAHACQVRLRMLRDVWRKKQFPNDLKMRIGVNTGDVLLGNMGTKKKLNFTAIGPVVSAACRLEKLNKRFCTHILIGEQTFNIVKDLFLCEWVSYVAHKDKTDACCVYRLVAPIEECNVRMKGIQNHLESAKRSYFDGDFKNTLKCCEFVSDEVIKLGSNDMHYKFVIDIVSNAKKRISNKNN
ncbi:adenylate cyclase [Acrasis kona]|uniref:Adenylate cyclase n=1 Tax=Acrasis kona TaxID=1008807 RepID=A0AAW2Z8K8_9EUKA